MNRRRFVYSAGTISISRELLFIGCNSSEEDIIRYATIAGTAAVSIGTVLKLQNPALGDQIINTANAVVLAAQEWNLGSGQVSTLVNALNSLRLILESIPTSGAGTVAALIPIAIAAIQSIFNLLGKEQGAQLQQTQSTAPLNWQAAQIPHTFGHSPEKDFEKEWNRVQRENHINGVITFKE